MASPGLQLVAAALVFAWIATAEAQTSASPPTPTPETAAAPPSAPTKSEILSRHLHLLTPQEPTPEGILAPEPSVEAAAPLLRRVIPGLAEDMEQLPPFLRDTSLRLHLRSFYFNRLNSDNTQNEALGLRRLARVSIGMALGHLRRWSCRLHVPAALCAAGRGWHQSPAPVPDNPQDSILVLGQAYGQLRYKEYALLTGYRQIVNEGYLNPQDSRMVPNTFEGVTIKGTIDPISYNVGYLTAIKLRQETEFHNMAEAAGVVGGQNRGLVLTRLSSEPLPGLSLYAANYLVPDVFNTAYGYGEYTHDLTSDLTFKIGLQGTDHAV